MLSILPIVEKKIDDLETSVKQYIKEFNILPPARDVENIIKNNISLPQLRKHV